MPWTTPRAWANGDIPDGAMLNSHIRDNLQYLKDVLDGVQSQAIVLTNTVRLSSTQPSLIWEETDAPTDNKRAHLLMSTGDGRLRFQFLNDSGGGGGNYLDITRVGNNSVDDVQFYRSAVLMFEVAVNDQQVRMPDGSVGTPALTWISDPDTGLYRIGANNIGLAVGGAKHYELSATGTIIGNSAAETRTRVLAKSTGVNPVLGVETDLINCFLVWPNGSVAVGGGSLASGAGVIGIYNCTAAPSGTPTSGGVLYVEAGALKYKGSSGTTTTLANA